MPYKDISKTIFVMGMFFLCCCLSAKIAHGEVVYEPLPPGVERPYSTPPDPQKIITAPDGAQFPVDQLLIRMLKNAPRSEADKIASSLGGEIIGYVPTINLYQLSVPASNKEDLDNLIARAKREQFVSDAYYNLLAALVGPSYWVPSDNDDLFSPFPYSSGDTDVSRGACHLAHIGYFPMLTILEKVRPLLSPVRVGIIDSGLDLGTGQFDDVRPRIITAGIAPLFDSDPGKHGTIVTSIIAADNDRISINGIVPPALGNNLTLLIENIGSYDHAQLLLNADIYASEGAHVINASFTMSKWGPLGIPGRPYYADWRELMSYWSNVIFVAAAPNAAFELVDGGGAPAGIDLPNVVTVGGTSLCRTTAPRSDSAYGPGINVWAPSENIAVSAKPGATVSYSSGNSLAAPQVTALAAILKSIDPGMTPRQFKEDILGSPTYFLNYATEVVERIIARGASTAALDIIDNDRDRVGDGTGTILRRIWSTLKYRVDTIGDFGYRQRFSLIDETVPPAVIYPTGGFSIQADGSADTFSVTCLFCRFAANSEFAISDRDIPGTAAIGFTYNAGSTSAIVGNATSGRLKFEGCFIEDRIFSPMSTPATDVPLFVSTWAEFTGQMDLATTPIRSVDIAGGFFLQFYAQPPIDPTLANYLEANCERGIPAFR